MNTQPYGSVEEWKEMMRRNGHAIPSEQQYQHQQTHNINIVNLDAYDAYFTKHSTPNYFTPNNSQNKIAPIDQRKTCTRCYGSGTIEIRRQWGDPENDTCPHCGGVGKV